MIIYFQAIELEDSLMAHWQAG